jgi:FkbM family methyltransferase
MCCVASESSLVRVPPNYKTVRIGICIEANPQYWRDLSFRDCQVVAAAVGKNRMENVVFQNAHETGGIVHKNFDQRSVSDAKESMKVYTVQLHEILERIHAPQEIDFFSLDVEGAEEYVMDAFPFDKYKIKVMTIERPKKGLQVLLKNHGYVPIAFVSTFGETLWAHSSYLETLNLAALKQFALPVQAAGFSMNARAVLTEPIYHTQ